MKILFLALALLPATEALAGQNNRGPDVRIICNGPKQTVYQQGSNLLVALDADNYIVQALTKSRILVPGYARDGFRREPMVIASEDLALRESDPTQVIQGKNNGKASISNHWDYTFAQLEARPNGQKQRLTVTMNALGKSMAKVSFQKEVAPLTQCLRTERQEMYGQEIEVCVKEKILASGFNTPVGTFTVNFSSCTYR